MPAERITLRSQVIGMLFASPYIVGLLGLLATPLVLSFYYSFTDYPLLKPPMWIGIDNYSKMLSDPVFWTVLKNTLIYAAASVPFTLSLSVLLAVLLNQKIPGQAIFRTIIFLPSLVPAAAAAMLWLWVLNGKQGLLNIFLISGVDTLNAVLTSLGASAIDWSPPNWLLNKYYIMPVFVLLSAFSIGNAVVIFLAGLQDIPAELYEAAEIDGASTMQRFFNVTLPMLSPVIFFNLIMGIIGAWQVFTLPYIMVGAGPDRSAYFYSMYLFDTAFMQQRMGYASAMAWIQFLVIFGLTMIVMWTSKRWVHYR